MDHPAGKSILGRHVGVFPPYISYADKNSLDIVPATVLCHQC